MQGPYKAAGQALEVIPRTLAQNCGTNVIRALTKLRAKHSEKGGSTFGIDGNKGAPWHSPRCLVELQTNHSKETGQEDFSTSHLLGSEATMPKRCPQRHRLCPCCAVRGRRMLWHQHS